MAKRTADHRGLDDEEHRVVQHVEGVLVPGRTVGTHLQRVDAGATCGHMAGACASRVDAGVPPGFRARSVHMAEACASPPHVAPTCMNTKGVCHQVIYL